ncbi:probable RNA-binding protein 19 [Coregonus clupeaformis]|uniref:probable RNA-binding protein 19 n=1 Tax=Coregonus clupeaformis TaxID=59861 RepID=UPI001BE11130|nr:probable RNA-binding protein 19 [Coregonus clupeaformis]
MSRLIVKNLPNGMKEERFKGMFAAFGTLTDCGLKFTKEGKFRKFGFVGFKTEEDADKALKHFNKSFVDTSRVTVEMCKSFGDPTKARAWSKHSRGPATATAPRENKKEKKKKESPSILGKLEDDEGFQEFVSVHQNRNQAPTWANDALPQSAAPETGQGRTREKNEKKKPASDDYLNFDSDESDEEEEEEEEKEEEDQGADKQALKSGLSDMEYLRSKVAQTGGAAVEENDYNEEEEDEDAEDEPAPVQQTDGAYESGDRDCIQRATAPASSLEKSQGKPGKQQETEPTTEFTVKLRGCPFNVKEQQVREFMTPLKPAAIRIIKNATGNKTGYIYVDLRSEEEVEKALKKNKDYMGGRYIEVFRTSVRGEGRAERRDKGSERSFTRELKDDEEEEDVAESGRLFIRNLPYTCTEEELQDLFTKHGPLAEVVFPIDNLTKKPKGFAFVSYMIPENAVTALAQLDGHIFQGRMLHLLPSTLKKEKADSAHSGPGSSSYKRQKDAKNKAASTSSHNWNTLFLGTSAVADAIAEKYNTTKSQVLDHESKGSVAVRMALGETQIVQETRQFLLDSHVCLDSFSQAAGPRSMCVFLVKNLPAGVTVEDLEELFSPHGTLGRVLLPPAGLTAIIEYLEPTEAKRAFTRLAYSKFQHVPLYLEWAPTGVFSAAMPSKTLTPDPEPTTKTSAQEEKEEEEEEEEEAPGSTLFIKNLNFTTTEETLRETFSKCGTLKTCTISKKKDKIGRLLSMGYGFVTYQTQKAAEKAIRQLQHCSVDDHQLELKVSERATKSAVVSRKKQAEGKQTSSKILVRNVPFQATVREIRELFCTFGELKTVRLPKKASGTGTGAHRGFGFVDFLTKQDAKKAFSALCHSTHLYGRRLVLEWADAEDTVETLRRKTAEHFHDVPKKKRKAEVMEGIMETMEAGGAEDD